MFCHQFCNQRPQQLRHIQNFFQRILADLLVGSWQFFLMLGMHILQHHEERILCDCEAVIPHFVPGPGFGTNCQSLVGESVFKKSCLVAKLTEMSREKFNAFLRHRQELQQGHASVSRQLSNISGRGVPSLDDLVRVQSFPLKEAKFTQPGQHTVRLADCARLGQLCVCQRNRLTVYCHDFPPSPTQQSCCSTGREITPASPSPSS